MKLDELDNILNERLDISYDLDEVKEFVMFLMAEVAQFHIYHLITKNGTHHLALGEFYDCLEDISDAVAENVIGNFPESFMSDTVEDKESEYEVEMFMGYNLDRCIQEADSIRNYSTLMIEKLDRPANQGLVNKLISVQEAVDKLLYKLQLH